MSRYNQEFILNIGFLIVANLLVKPYYIFFVERVVQNDVGTDIWGHYFTLFSLSMVPQILLDLGISSYLNKNISSDRAHVQDYLNKTIWLRPIGALVFSMVFLVLVYLNGHHQDLKQYVWWIILNQILVAGILYLRAFVAGMGHYRWDSMFSILDKLVFILIFFFVKNVNQSISILSFFWIQCSSLVFSLMVIGGWLAFQDWFSFSLQRPSISQSIGMVQAGLPYAMIFILMVLYCRMEPVWISLLTDRGLQQAGIYAAAYRLLDASNMMGFLFAGLLLPMFSHLGSIHQFQQNLQSLYNLAWKIMVSASSMISILVACHHKTIMQSLYVAPMGDILLPVILNLIPLTINYLLSTLLTATGHIKKMNNMFAWSIVLNVICHLLLTPTYGAWGAACAAMITQLATTILLLRLIHQSKLIQLSATHAWQLAGCILITLCISVLLSKLISNEWLSLVMEIILSFIIFSFVGLIPVKTMLEWVAEKSR